MIPERKLRIRSGSFQLFAVEDPKTSPVTSPGGGNRNNKDQNRPIMSILTVQRRLASEMHQLSKRIKTFNLAYSIYNPHLLTSKKLRPLLMIHGGPGIPSDYLKPLAKSIQNRSVILYDQIGCGDSSEPSDIEAYSIDFALEDLEKLILHIGIQTSGLHLMGHSFGGILAYKYMVSSLSREDSSTIPNILSLTLCSTPMDIASTMIESEQMFDSICNKEEQNLTEQEAQRFFHSTFICRSHNNIIPTALQEAYAKRGSVFTCDNVQDVSLQFSKNTVKTLPPPTMLLRGEYDFCSPEQCFGMQYILQADDDSQFGPFLCKTLEKCSHYPMLEDLSLFTKYLGGFLMDIDEIIDS